jgi:hypothetical protein
MPNVILQLPDDKEKQTSMEEGGGGLCAMDKPFELNQPGYYLPAVIA